MYVKINLQNDIKFKKANNIASINLNYNSEVIVIRAFIGIDFQNEIKKGIYELQQKLKKYAVKGRWKDISNFHLTLKFLDEINEAQRITIDRTLKDLCMNEKAFSLDLMNIGTFDSRDTIRVLWLGIGGDIKGMLSLQKEIENVMVPIGFEKEKRGFNPHITIGQDIIFTHSFEEIKREIGQVHIGTEKVKSISLYKSEQIQGKRVYTKESEYFLK